MSRAPRQLPRLPLLLAALPTCIYTIANLRKHAYIYIHMGVGSGRVGGAMALPIILLSP